MEASANQFEFNFIPERRIFRVSELSRVIREKLEAQFADIWVEGEISNFRPAASGHMYFTLKDETAQLRCVAFRQQARFWKFRPQDGLKVTARGRISVYEQRGEYQLQVELLEPQGRGALQLAFEQLKEKLAAEGLFAPARKKPLPRLPRRIGVITSPHGAVIQDMIRILERRHQSLCILIFPVPVQGEGAAEKMAEALRFFNLRPAPHEVDVLVLARGGGSLEDLWAFNEEILARAIAASRIPVISAVGHETDFTIADFVADLRAPTPSAAAEMVIETELRLQEAIAGCEEALRQRMRYRLLQLRHDLAEMTRHRGFRTLQRLLAEAAQRSDDASLRLIDAMRRSALRARRRWEQPYAFLRHFDWRARIKNDRLRFNRTSAVLAQQMHLMLLQRRNRLESVAAEIRQLSPTRILERGYAIAFNAEGKVLKDSAQVAPGDSMSVRLAHGSVAARVEKLFSEESLSGGLDTPEENSD